MPEADPQPQARAADLAEAADRLADRFRAMPQSRLTAPVPGHASRALAGLALARRLSATSLALEGEPPREVPDVGAFAVGDQLAVTGHDLAVAAAGRPGVLVDALADVEATAAATS